MSFAQVIAKNGFTKKGWEAIVDKNGGVAKFSDIFTRVSDIMARIERLTTGNGLPINSAPKTWIKLDQEFERLKKEFAKSKKWSDTFKQQKKVIAAYSEPLWQRHDVLQDWMHKAPEGYVGDENDLKIKGSQHPEYKEKRPDAKPKGFANRQDDQVARNRGEGQARLGEAPDGPAGFRPREEKVDRNQDPHKDQVTLGDDEEDQEETPNGGGPDDPKLAKREVATAAKVRKFMEAAPKKMTSEVSKYLAIAPRATKELGAIAKAQKAAMASGVIAEVARVARALQAFDQKYPLDAVKKTVGRHAEKVVEEMTLAHKYKYKTEAGQNANVSKADFDTYSANVFEVSAKFSLEITRLEKMHKRLQNETLQRLRDLREPVGV